ncbi:MAG: helix-turn-helix domain-containing protein [Pseudomonadota bacterium]
MPEPDTVKTATVGRPKLLSRDEILDAAVELGLEQLTMKQLATHLGVGTATLYQYFDNRDALMRSAAVRALALISLPRDVGQEWTEYARDYAFVIMQLLSDNPTYIYNYTHSDYGLEVLFRLSEEFLSVMKAKGFSVDAAMRVYHMIALASMSGAIEAVRERAFAMQGHTFQRAVTDQLDDLEDLEVPLVREAVGTYSMSAREKVEVLLDAAFSSIANEK